MIKHIVMWKLKPNAGGRTAAENAREIKRLLMELPEKIPLIKCFEVGINVSPSPNAYDAVLVSVFESQEDVAAYRDNPDHKKVSEFVKSVRESRCVVDYTFD